MDSKERHEMMTNELADWLGHIPGFLNQYRNQLIGAALIIIGLISWPILNRWRQQSDLTVKAEITNMLDSLDTVKFETLRQQQDASQTFTAGSFLVSANNLADEAKKAPNEDLAALALIKRGQALRMDLLYRKEVIPEDQVSAQIKQAQEAYQQAFDKARMPAVKAMAQLGLGLCSEESGQIEQAKNIYQKIVDEPSYAGTPLPAVAKERIDKMADNNTKYVFVPAPEKKPVADQPAVVSPTLTQPTTEPAAPSPVNTTSADPNSK